MNTNKVTRLIWGYGVVTYEKVNFSKVIKSLIKQYF